MPFFSKHDGFSFRIENSSLYVNKFTGKKVTGKAGMRERPAAANLQFQEFPANTVFGNMNKAVSRVIPVIFDGDKLNSAGFCFVAPVQVSHEHDVAFPLHYGH